ncbi:guanitoxin biosynthesis L-arginine gamma (S) hydroxylase [Chromobacterium sp. ASV23]|uniref:guanitoxin biosynthesis L-arginine gamma (S) hydroxylase n=1 Tax=Chromobacterium sp. ASV23 TaxID=2795110 RepID=UPI0018EB15B8
MEKVGESIFEANTEILNYSEKSKNTTLAKHKFSPEITKSIKTLYQLNNWRAPLAVISDHGTILLFAWLAHKFPLLIPISIIVIGSRQRALATILHEASHLSLSENRNLGKILGTFLSGYLIFQSWDSYKQSHVLNHHHFLGNQHKDPDYSYYISSGVYNHQSKKQFIWKYFWRPILSLNTFSNIKYLLRHRLLESSSRQELLFMLISLIGYTIIGSSIAGPEFILLYWILPYLTSFQAISWFIELAEHYPLLGKSELDIFSSRNRFGGLLENLLTGMHGERYHLIHHLFPRIPYWNIKKAHEILMQDSTYRQVNINFGGIFTTTTAAKPLWQSRNFLGITQ